MVWPAGSAARRASRSPSSGLITASEIACYAYCPEQWRLEYGLGLPPENQAAIAAGTRHHEENSAAERVAGGALNLGRVLVVLPVVVLLLWLVFSR